MRLEWARLAEQDLIQIVTHIAADSPNAAQGLLDEIRGKAAMLVDHPRMGREVEKGSAVRVLILRASYRLLYRLEAGVVMVLRVKNAAQRWP